MAPGGPVVALALVATLGAAPVRAEMLAVMPAKMLDTSQEATDQRADHERRLARLTEALASDLGGAGPYTGTIAVTADTIAAACPRETATCLIDVARDAGGDHALFVVVQKSSSLILQTFAHVVDLRTNALVVSRDLTFRGDNDEAWTKMEAFLARTLASAR